MLRAQGRQKRFCGCTCLCCTQPFASRGELGLPQTELTGSHTNDLVKQSTQPHSVLLQASFAYTQLSTDCAPHSAFLCMRARRRAHIWLEKTAHRSYVQTRIRLQLMLSSSSSVPLDCILQICKGKN